MSSDNVSVLALQIENNPFNAGLRHSQALMQSLGNEGVALTSVLRQTGMAMAGLVVGSGMVRGLTSTILAASAAREDLAQFNHVMRNTAKTADEMVKSLTSDSFGRTSAQAQQMLMGLTSLAKGMGMTDKAAVSLSGEFSKMAVDNAYDSAKDFAQDFVINVIDPIKDIAKDFHVNVYDLTKDFIKDFPVPAVQMVDYEKTFTIPVIKTVDFTKDFTVPVVRLVDYTKTFTVPVGKYGRVGIIWVHCINYNILVLRLQNLPSTLPVQHDRLLQYNGVIVMEKPGELYTGTTAQDAAGILTILQRILLPTS